MNEGGGFSRLEEIGDPHHRENHEIREPGNEEMISFWQARVRNGERRSRSRNRSGADFRRFSLWCSSL